jgi:UDP-N-acetylmuramate--alanine ligase
VAQHVRQDRPGEVEVVTYGERPGCDVRMTRVAPSGGGVEFELAARSGLNGPVSAVAGVGRVRLQVPGRHNAANAAASVVAGAWLGYDAGCLAEGLAAFGGARRRFELKGRAGGIEVRDDYAHHPTEVAAALRAARSVVAGRVVVVFQPHLYSRTRIFAGAFGRALALADEVVVLDVYGAREDPEPGVTGELVAQAVPLQPGVVHFAPTLDDAHALMLGLARPGDLVITMGAGDVTGLGPRLIASLAHLDAQVS